MESFFIYGEPDVGKSWSTVKQLCEMDDGKIAYINLDLRGMDFEHERLEVKNISDFNLIKRTLKRLKSDAKSKGYNFLVLDGVTNWAATKVAEIGRKESEHRHNKDEEIDILDMHIMTLQKWGNIRNLLIDLLNLGLELCRSNDINYIGIGNESSDKSNESAKKGKSKGILEEGVTTCIRPDIQGSAKNIYRGFFDNIARATLNRSDRIRPWPPELQFVDMRGIVQCRAKYRLRELLTKQHEITRTTELCFVPMDWKMLFDVVNGKRDNLEFIT